MSSPPNLRAGSSCTSGVGKRSFELRVSVGSTPMWRGGLVIAGPFVTLTLRRTTTRLPAAVVGEVEQVLEALVTLPSDALVRASLGDEIHADAVAADRGSYLVRITRYRAHDVISGAQVHETLDVSLTTAAADTTLPSAAIAGGWVRGDRLGFAIAHPAASAHAQTLAGAEMPLLDFLTTDARADAFLAEGWMIPFLGVRALWPWRVLVVADAMALEGLPLGQRVMGERHVALAPSAQHDVIRGESLSSSGRAANEGRFAGLGGGFFSLDVFVAGGEIATFVLTPAEAERGSPVQPIVNCDVHALWRETAMEGLCAAQSGVPSP